MGAYAPIGHIGSAVDHSARLLQPTARLSKAEPPKRTLSGMTRGGGCARPKSCVARTAQTITATTTPLPTSGLLAGSAVGRFDLPGDGSPTPNLLGSAVRRTVRRLAP